MKNTATNDSVIYSTTPEKYLIVTVNKYYSAIQDFVEWKESEGYDVKVLHPTSWSDTTAVKNAIMNECGSSDELPRFLLIVGNADDVPPYSRIGYFPSANGINWTISGFYPTDHPYSCIDTNSIFPTIARGRILVNNVPELQNAMDKILFYQCEQDHFGKMTLCATFERKANDSTRTIDNRRFVRTCEEFHDAMISAGLYDEAQRIYRAENEDNPMYYDNENYGHGEPYPTCLLRANGFP